jgi:hypothetical protein
MAKRSSINLSTKKFFQKAMPPAEVDTVSIVPGIDQTVFVPLASLDASQQSYSEAARAHRYLKEHFEI